MRCVVVVLVLVGTSCHHADEPPKDHCELTYERLIRIGATKFRETPQELLDECRDGRMPRGFILECGLQSDSDQEARRCIDDVRRDELDGSGSAQ